MWKESYGIMFVCSEEKQVEFPLFVKNWINLCSKKDVEGYTKSDWGEGHFTGTTATSQILNYSYVSRKKWKSEGQRNV